MIKILFKFVFSLFMAAILLAAGMYALNLVAPSLFMKVFTQFVPMNDIKKKLHKDFTKESSSKIQQMLNEKVKTTVSGFSLKDIGKRLKSAQFPDLKEKQMVKIEKFTARDFQMQVSEKDLTDYLHGIDGMSEAEIALYPDKAAVMVPVKVAKLTVNVTIEGHFVVQEKTKVKFVGDKLFFGKANLPAASKDEILNSIQPVVDFSGLDVPLTLKDVKIFQGYLLVEGAVRGTS